MAWIDEAASDSAGEGAVRTSARRRVEWWAGTQNGAERKHSKTDTARPQQTHTRIHAPIRERAPREDHVWIALHPPLRGRPTCLLTAAPN